jgi:hypothetical protein
MRAWIAAAWLVSAGLCAVVGCSVLVRQCKAFTPLGERCFSPKECGESASCDSETGAGSDIALAFLCGSN